MLVFQCRDMSRHPTHQFARALRELRVARGIPQEEFDQVSSRTYISALERGLKQPTLSKVDDLAGVLGLHPLTLLVASYCRRLSVKEAVHACELVQAQLAALLGSPDQD